MADELPNVVPYHWMEAHVVDGDYGYLSSLYEALMPQLAHQLNVLHQTEHSIRYWRTVAGFWLGTFIHVIYDRYRSIQAATQFPITRIAIPADNNAPEWVAHDAEDFVLRSTGDDLFNEHLYGQIIRLVWKNWGIVREFDRPRGSAPTPSPRPFWLPLYQAAIRLKRWVAQRFNRQQDFVFHLSGLPAEGEKQLAVALGCNPVRFFRADTPKAVRYSHTMRESLRFSCGESEFERILSSLLPRQIPTNYVEGYRDLGGKTPRHIPKLIQTTVGWADSTFAIWAAACAEKGSFVIGHQHGGIYGTGKWIFLEGLERSISDMFVTYGWTGAGGGASTSALPSPRLSRMMPARRDDKGDILVLLGGYPRYSYHLFSAPQGARFANYIQQQLRFAQAFGTATRRRITVRSYPEDYGWGIVERMKRAHPWIRWSDHNVPLSHELERAGLLVGTYNATVPLEGLASNFPTVLFWDPRDWLLRDEAVDYFRDLQVAGIYHETPESAVAHIESILGNVMDWWNSPLVQETRQAFCRQFARVSSTWVAQWATEISSRLTGHPANIRSHDNV